MSRSRSSFDLSSAIATATSLSVVTPEEQPAALYRGVPLVSFGPTAAGPPTILPPESSSRATAADELADLASESSKPETAETSGSPLTAQPAASLEERVAAAPAPTQREGQREVAPASDEVSADAARRPPKLPDLSGIKNPLLRCERIIQWLEEAVGVANVFIADAAGLPVAGETLEAEARLAATGVVSAAVAHLAASIPGNTSALFEMHVGDGPFFQIIGFEVLGASYMVGFQRATPLAFRQAHAVRLACRHALGPESAVSTADAEHAGRATRPGVRGEA